jgi:tetratricopeptide (TPR) repeat protein
MVYYGLGGVGKTALSKQLERRITEGDIEIGRDLPKLRVTTRVDFGESGDFDLEGLLLRFRADIGNLRKGWPAFDLAFQFYWEKQHPGESLPEFLRHNSFLRQRISRLDFVEQMQNIFSQVLTELGMAWTPTRIAFRLASLTHEHLMHSMTYRRLSDRCPFLEPIVTADSQMDMLSYMPSLIGWQLDQIDHPNAIVFFIDTFEAIENRQTRETERIIQRLIFLLPTVLFVITSRNHLDWAVPSSTDELDYTGPNRWPQLELENKDLEPRQHLIGSLSAEDCDLYLRTVLQNEDGTPILNDTIRERIIAGSDGLPLYLDLSVTQYLELRAAGAPINPDAFGGPLSSVVYRIMRHLDNEERNILRGVSLLDAFDVDLAHAASDASDAKISRFINSSLVTRTTDLAWPYMIHSQLRNAIQQADAELNDAWSQREWREAAERICAHLSTISNAAQRNRDRIKVAACLTQAVRLSNRYDTVPAWILEAAQFLADTGLWRTLDVRLPASVQSDPIASALVQGLRGISLRRSGSLERSVREFDAALASGRLQGQPKDLLRLHRAHSLRNSGQYDEAAHEYEELVQGMGPYAARAALQLADIYYLRGQFMKALDSLEPLPQDNPDLLGESLRIRGHIYRANANFDMAELTYRRVLEHARSIQSPALEGKALTNLAETLCWRSEREGRQFADEAIEFNEAIGNQLEILKANVARAIVVNGDESEASVREALRIADSCHYRAGAIFALAARVFHQALHSNQVATGTANQILDIANAINVYHYWYEIVEWWLASYTGVGTLESGNGQPAADWLGDPPQAQQRWQAVLGARRGVK